MHAGPKVRVPLSHGKEAESRICFSFFVNGDSGRVDTEGGDTFHVTHQEARIARGGRERGGGRDCDGEGVRGRGG